MTAYAEGRKWRAIGDGELRSKFLGTSIQLRPVGVFQLTFNDGDEFTWHKVTDSDNDSSFPWSKPKHRGCNLLLMMLHKPASAGLLGVLQ